jgi:hypothetical protein
MNAATETTTASVYPFAHVIEYTSRRGVNPTWTPEFVRWEVAPDASGVTGLVQCGGVEVALTFIGVTKDRVTFASNRLKQRILRGAIEKCRKAFAARMEAELPEEYVEACKALYEVT